MQKAWPWFVAALLLDLRIIHLHALHCILCSRSLISRCKYEHGRYEQGSGSRPGRRSICNSADSPLQRPARNRTNNLRLHTSTSCLKRCSGREETSKFDSGWSRVRMCLVLRTFDQDLYNLALLDLLESLLRFLELDLLADHALHIQLSS